MEIISYFITKPIILLFEIIFMIFGRIYGTGGVVVLVSVVTGILFAPLFYAAASRMDEPFPKEKNAR